MSNKNLKVYKILFITQIKTLHLNVKFPCQIKMIWKRSNQTAETKKAKLVDGKAVFNQKLSLNVNMYFDTKLNKFVQKKCIYSFLIFTQKGQKSAGSVTYDLADFFNKRLYDVDEVFPLQKCPVKDTTVQMKIHYQESVQGGYDSMSQISVTSEMDTSSTNPLDLSEMNESKDQTSQKSNSTLSATKSVQQTQVKQQPKQQVYTNLNDSDVESEQYKSRKIITQKQIEYRVDSGKQNKIGENIKGINEVTSKLNDFTAKFSKSLSYDLQEKKRQIKRLTQELQSAQQLNKKIQSQLNEQKNLKNQFQAQILNMKSSLSANQGQSSQRIEQLQRKLEQERKTTEKLEKRLLDASSKGQQQGRYVEQLKQQFKKQEGYLNQKIQKLAEELKTQKYQRGQIQNRLNRSQQNYNELNQKYDRLLNKYETLQSDLKKRQIEVEQARINLDNAVQSLVESLSNLI